MKLYHLTREKHLESICEHGLRPGLDEDVLRLTLGIPAVWLTTSRESPEWCLHMHADAILLTVEPRKKKLFHWRTWFRENWDDNFLKIQDRERPENDSNSHYVYFGTVLPSRIKDWAPVAWTGETEEVQALIAKHQEILRQQPWGSA